MATVIRLARYGAKKRPYYHIVVTDSRNARNSGNILGVVGKYDPMLAKDNEKRVILKIDEIKDWMAKGAKPSDRVYRSWQMQVWLQNAKFQIRPRKIRNLKKQCRKLKTKPINWQR